MVAAIAPGIWVEIVPPAPADTYASVLQQFDSAPATALTRARAWEWYRRLIWQDYAEDRHATEREGAKAALTFVITECAFLELDAALRARERAMKFGNPNKNLPPSGQHNFEEQNNGE